MSSRRVATSASTPPSRSRKGCRASSRGIASITRSERRPRRLDSTNLRLGFSMYSRRLRGTMSLVFDLLGYRRRWRLLEQLRTPYVSETAPIVVGGCGSSGTTLLRRMLDRHPAVCCGPESTVFLERVSGPEELASRLGFRADQIEGWQCASRSQAEFIDRFQSASLARSGKRVWADKTPENVRRFAFVRRHFPKARLIHMIRDGRDVACSLRSQGWMKVRHWTPSDAAARCAAYWVERVSAGRASRSDPGYIEIRYEQ